MTDPAASSPAPVPDAPLFRRVLFCTDFSPTADRAFTFALRVASRNPGAVLHLLHVIPEPSAQFWKGYLYDLDEDVDTRAKREIDAKLDAAYRPRIPPSLPVVVAMRIGEPGRQILEYAAAEKPDIIVIGRQGAGSVGKLLFGNVCERVVRKAPCPVLLVPPEPR